MYNYEVHKRYVEKHKEKVKAYRKKWREENKGRIYELSKYRRESSPKVTYRYETNDGVVLYVGSGTLLRAKAHKSISSWWNDSLILITVEQIDIAHARRDEYQWIITYNPVYNKDR